MNSSGLGGRSLLIALALGLISGLAFGILQVAAGLESLGASAPFLVGLGAFVVALYAAWAALVQARRSLRSLAQATHNVVRDTGQRVPIGTAGNDVALRELGEWVNFLAEDVQKSQAALARERTLLAAVADGLTQGLIAVDGDLRIELLNDAARKMLGVTSSPVGEPLLVFVRVPELRDLIENNQESSSEIQLPNGPRTLIRVALNIVYAYRSVGRS